MHRLTRPLVLAVFAVVAAAVPATAASLVRGDYELGLSALIQDTDSSGFYLNISTRFGYMITKNHEAGPVVSFLYVKPDQGASITASSLGAFYRYNFSTDNRYVIPFLGFSANGYTGDLANSLNWSWQAESGVRILAGRHVSINNLLFWHRDYKKAWWVTSVRYFGLSVGVSLML
jgi:hypothetical protein